MQLSTGSQRNYQQPLVTVVEVKAFCLEGEILSKMGSLPESEQAQLLALAAAKFQDEKLKEAFNMVLRLEGSLSKGLALIDFLPYLIEWDSKIIAGGEILKCINKVDKKEKIELIEKLIPQLEWQKKATVGWSACLTNLWQDLALIVKNSCEFELKEQVSLEGKSFNLMYWNDAYKHYSLYPQEKKRLLEEIKATQNSTEKYLALLAMLKDFPLEEEEINDLACLTLEVLTQQVSQNNNGDRTDVNLQQKLELLAFLPKEHHKNFGKKLYDELCKNQDPNNLLNDIINSSIFVKNYRFDTEEDAHSCYVVGDINNALDYVSNFCQKTDEEYFELVVLLTSEKWTTDLGWREIWTNDVLVLIERIKSPIMQANALLLLLERTKPGKLKREIVKQTLSTLFSINDEIEVVMLTSKLLKHLSRVAKKDVLPKLMTEIAFPWNEAQQAELLVGLLPYLTPKLRKKAFEMALSIGNYFDTVWVCIAFAPYLTQQMRERVIQDGFNVLNKPAYTITFSQKALMLKQLIHYGLGSANEG